MPTIQMITTAKGSVDGIQVQDYFAGNQYDVTDRLAYVFVEELGAASYVSEDGAVVTDASVIVGEATALDGLSRAQLVEVATQKGLTFHPRATKADLVELLAAATAVEVAPVVEGEETTVEGGEGAASEDATAEGGETVEGGATDENQGTETA